MSVLMVQTTAAARKDENNSNMDIQVNSNNEETDHLNIREALNYQETYNLPKLIVERSATRDGITIQIMDKNYKRELTQASNIHTKLSEINENLGKIVKQIENMANELRIKSLALALTNEIFRITKIQTFKQVCNRIKQNNNTYLSTTKVDIKSRRNTKHNKIIP